ncbi:hypothetical protein ZYGR_0AM00350 [Zygosaccharomyces rouxii]|uniref:Uracil catabolism protein 4 n=1 Tax=Zygosaccharomyces rouxii TaxID=4956 RepID=A0A1Q3AFJ8_ZYGRO|nr:hypothetical protein ZYGR_0AM00350 [Zygosaccharomyces rouxii]
MTVSKPAEFFKSIRSVRDTTGPVYQLIRNQGEGNYYKLDESKLDQVAEYLCKIIARDYGIDYDSIPPHGRWQHLNAGGHLRVEQLVDQWRATHIDEIEISRRLVDLLVVSVLVDAGAGNLWKYGASATESYSRSEGLAVASYYLFVDGEFSNDLKVKCQVNGQRLKNFTMDQFVRGFQISEENPLNGAEGRLQLIQKLGESLLAHPEVFGSDARPGGIVDYLKKETSTDNCIDLNDVWKALMDGFVTIWPQGRATIQGQPLGDSWSLDTKLKTGKDWDDDFLNSLVTFHKLTQWLCYSLLVPLEKYGFKFQISNKELQTGLPEYRNGGLFYDFGVIALKPEHLKRGLALSETLGNKEPIPTFTAEDGAIVEWRCLTIGLLDELHELVNKRLKTTLTLPQVIEAGSWKAGREIAAEKRPVTRGPPIELQSDGTVF